MQTRSRSKALICGQKFKVYEFNDKIKIKGTVTAFFLKIKTENSELRGIFYP